MNWKKLMFGLNILIICFGVLVTATYVASSELDFYFSPVPQLTLNSESIDVNLEQSVLTSQSSNSNSSLSTSSNTLTKTSNSKLESQTNTNVNSSKISYSKFVYEYS
jgi:hypothetical protein